MRRIYVLLLPLFLFAMVTHKIDAQTVVASYPFSGTTEDVSTSGNDAANIGASYTQDRFGLANSALHFDGVTSRVVAPNNDALNTAATTVSLWAKMDALPAQGEYYLVSFGGWQERWKVSLPTHGKPIWTTNADAISDMDSGDGNELAEDTWTHLVFVHDGTEDRIYMNGVLANTKAVAGDLNSTDNELGIGFDAVGGGSTFLGSLDDVIIYDGAMDAAGVAALFAAQSVEPVFPNGLVASYAFDGNFRDDSDYRNHGKGDDVEFITNRFGFGDRAAEFNGTTSSFVAANSAPLNSPTTTVAFWVKANTLPVSGEAYIASFGGWQERWKISLPSHGKMVWTTHAGGTCCSDLDAGGGNELVPGEWVHAVFVHDGTEDKIYINGVLVNSKAAPGDLDETGFRLGIGWDPIDEGNYFDGAVDDFQIYNVALSDTDIADLYAEQSTAVIDPDPKVLDLPFSGDFKDASQFANHGTPNTAELTYDRFGYAKNAVAINGGDGVVVDNSVQYNSDWTTVSFWVKMNELPASGEVYLLSFGGWQERWKVSLPSHGKPVWTTHGTTCCSDLDSGDGNELVVGEWTHVVVSHGPAQDKIYINGALANSRDAGTPLNDTDYDLGIGWDPIDGGGEMNGSIDEVQIYNEALTDQQVADLYAAQSAEPVFPGDIVADYPLNGNGTDVSPYHNHGDVLGATASLDRFDRSNHAMNFDGNDGIRADNSPQLNSAHTSVSFWVKANSLPASGEVYLLSFGGWQSRWKISLPSHGKPVWTTFGDACCSDLDSGDGNEVSTTEWKHFVMVHDGVNDYIYVNGVEANSKPAVGDLNTNTLYDLGIGFDPIDNGNYFDGMLDDLIIFETALTAGEVAALYAEQAATPVVTDNTAPEAPTNLEAEVAFTNVTLTWTASFDEGSGLAGYNVYLNSSLLRTVEETETTISGLTPLTLYEFGVSAVDSAGNESTVTTVFATTGFDEVPDTEAPSTPANLAVSPGSNSAVFSWDFSTDNVGVGGYVTFVDGNYIDSLPANENSVFVGGLDPSTLYTFEVYAYDLAGNDSEVAFITASTTDPITTAEPGLVAHYRFEGDATDDTPYNNHGTIGGNPVFETATHSGPAGQNIVFDGDRDSVYVPNAVQLISDYTTVSFWIRVDNVNVADPEAYVLDFGHWDERWKISLPQHLKIVWTTNRRNAQFDELIHDMDSGDGNELVEGFWWYVTMVHDGTDDIIYLDGQEVNRNPAQGELNSTARPFIMASDAVEGGRYFPGALDEVKVYNKALTSDEIQLLYETGSTVTGIKDLGEVNKYVEIIYPNPTKDDVLVKHGFTSGQDLVVRIFDQAGRQVSASRIGAADMDKGLFSVNVAALQGGLYSLNFVLEGKNLGSVPFVKQ